MKKLESLLADIVFESLPPAWSTFDLVHYSKAISLWDYQQQALQNAIKALWKYHSVAQANARKHAFFEWYTDNHITIAPLSLNKKRASATLLAPYYTIVDDRIAYEHFINRMGFWMATGSGKTLVIVKLIEVLRGLMQASEIPAHDVLVLTHREDLLKQLREQVNEFNSGGNNLFIRLRDLKEYAEVKRGFPSLLAHQEITVFYYRADNLSDEQKERIVDFRNYDNKGNWYVLLDEAHKGDKEDSKRQHIYSILSRNGFLFNFSATFTDDHDKLTTASEFNLSSFIQAGFGKHIAILKQENSAFRRDSGDFTDEEKQKIVLQSLLMLTYISKAREGLVQATGAQLYHRPLLVALVNSVNTEDADLKLFFAQLEHIAKGELSAEAFRRAKADLRNELKSEPKWMYEQLPFTPDELLFDHLTIKDILRIVFNAESHGVIEVLARPSNDKELAFKLQTTSAPFALIRIGDTNKWQKEMLEGYEFIKGFEDESFFERLNADDSDITLLMGSRSFYEGWDSNRPNVTTFINIGVGTDAEKFILQSVGRGVRIEPTKGKRKRLASLDTGKEISHLLFQKAKPFLSAIETLFIFGTNRTALESVFKELDQEKEKEEGTELALEVNLAAVNGHVLLVPTYRDSTIPLIKQREPRKFELNADELNGLVNYIGYLGDDRLLLAHHDLSPRQTGHIQTAITATNTYFNTLSGRKFGNMSILLPRLAQYLDILPSEFESFKPLDDEIRHYKHIRVFLRDVEELRRKIKSVQDYKDPEAKTIALKERFEQGELKLDALIAAIQKLSSVSEETFTPPHGAPLKIKNIAKHYYVPLLLSEDDKIDYIQHIIHVPSEVAFIDQLKRYLKAPDNLFASFDWWLFSRADETLDKIFIPYYDPSQNKMREFHPDFIFWLKRYADYFILFIDPKGMKNADYLNKIDGYKQIFAKPETGELRVFKHNGMRVRVALAMHTTDANQAPQEYKDFWHDNLDGILKLLTPSRPSAGG